MYNNGSFHRYEPLSNLEFLERKLEEKEGLTNN
jgi:hypothetical protein